MVVTDGVHLVADSISELHAFAERIGLKRSWFQGGSRNPHYDLISLGIRKRALAEGAVPYDTKGLLKREEWREKDGIH